MRVQQTLFFLLSLVATIHALALPAAFQSITEASRDLWKRKGGGGGGGKGGGSGSSSSGSSGGSRGSGTSNTGGRTSTGSGVAPAYGGGRYYGGGAAAPYKSGSSIGSVAPYLVVGGAFGFAGAYWAYGAYAYNYPHYWFYHNDTSNQNVTHPATCLCGEDEECGCDPSNNDTDYIHSVANDPSVAQLMQINGTDTLVVNGTLDNGTTASGGTDSGVGSLRVGLAQSGGWWAISAAVFSAVWYL